MPMPPTALFYAPYAIWRFHFETELELMEKYLRRGYDVTLLSCFGELPFCESNPHHKKYLCQLCQSRQASGVNWIGKDRIRVEAAYRITPEQQPEIDRLGQITLSSLADLRAVELEGSDLGLAALGSLISYLREPEPDVGQHLPLIRKLLQAAAIAHFSVKNYLATHQPDVFVLCNGRFSVFRPALRLAQAKGIETYIHERSGVLERYLLSRNTYPHDLDWMKQEVERLYTTSPLPEAEKQRIAQTWFEERRQNHPQSWVSYTRNQKQDLLPVELSQLPASVVKVVIFNSSEDECVTIPGWQNPFYKDQNEGIFKLLGSFRGDDRIRFFLRVHPNLHQVDNSQTRLLATLKHRFPELVYIPADSKVSTYALMDASDLVLTFGSTAGIEALAKGKPAILMGPAIYEDLGGVLRPNSHADLVALLRQYEHDRSLPPAGDASLAVTKYGFFQKMYGETFEYATPHSTFKVAMHKDGQEAYLKSALLPKVLLRLGV